MKESLSVLDIQALLGGYIDFDFMDQLAEPKRKRDGNYYTSYLAMFRQEVSPLPPKQRTLVIKEIMPAQVDNYRSISSIWNPYLETVYGVIPVGRFFISLNEFIGKPDSLCYSDKTLLEKRSLSLEDYVRHFGCLTEQEALIFMLQLCEGLGALKKFNIVHGDISPQNILLTDRFPMTKCPYPKIKGLHHTVSVKIIDFDIAREHKGFDHLVTTVEGTRLYAAPEILDYQSPTDRIDIYSLGCILSYMLTGKSPKQITLSELYKSCNPRVARIIAKCTLGYSQRYRSLAILKREIQTVIAIRWPSNLLQRIPGFRTGHLGYMCAAICGYSIFIPSVISEIFSPDMWLETLAFCLIPIFGLDIFRLGELSYIYTFYRDKYPWLRIVVRYILGIILPVVLLVI